MLIIWKKIPDLRTDSRQKLFAGSCKPYENFPRANIPVSWFTVSQAKVNKNTIYK